ncbi:MAG: hypothetical protein ABIR06_00520 [Cyclobacteriaceae bacterium]
MRKNFWSSIVFLFAFAMALVHSSIPHDHPDLPARVALKNHSHAQSHDHDGDHHNKPHNHDEGDNSNHDSTSDSDRPVFSHFSNADFTPNKSNFSAKGIIVLQCVIPSFIELMVPKLTEEKVEIPISLQPPDTGASSPPHFRGPPVS